MKALYFAFGLAMVAAAGHSYLSEKLFLQPLRNEVVAGSVFSGDAEKRLATAMFHMASLCWIAMAVSMLMLDPAGTGYRATLLVYAAVYATSGLGNFWAVGRPHPGGVVLLTASVLILASLYTASLSARSP